MTTNNIDTTQFNETDVIRTLRLKQTDELVADESVINDNESVINSEVQCNEVVTKSNRGRKKKYATEEERILARRAQQKAYRERKKKELAELKALKASLEKNSI